MKKQLLIAVAVAVAILAPLAVRAEVKALTDVPLIEDIGKCCNPEGEAGLTSTCAIGQQPKCGWQQGLSEGAKYDPAVPVTSFADARAAHEEVGAITIECDAGQTAGTQTGDYDIPDEVFVGGAPDWTGRWASPGCAQACNLVFDPDFVTSDGIYGLWFYNYGFDVDSAATPAATPIDRAECFRTNPAVPSTSYVNPGYTTNGIWGSDATATGCESSPANAYADDWVAGTIVDFVLPFGVRLSNTLYPGIHLEGKNQFDQRNTAQIDLSGTVTYPAVVFRWEANHRIDGYGPAADLPLPSSSYDRIKIFVPDILASLRTTPEFPSSFILGEDLFLTPARIPAGRTLVEQCYNGGLIVNQVPCNYDTTICVDIRGADPVYRENSPDILARQVQFTVEDPLGTQYRPAVLVVAIIRARGTTGNMTSNAIPQAHPNCDGYTDCYWVQNTSGGTVVPAPGGTDPNWLYVGYEEAVGPVSFTEPSGNYIQVDSGATTLNQYSTITCTLTDTTNVMFAELEMSMTSTCPLLCDWDWVNGTDLPASGCLIGDEAGCSCVGRINTPNVGVTVGISPDATGMTATVLRMSDDSIIVRVLTESGPNTPATLTLTGYNLMINDRALPGGIGCVELECEVSFPVAECANHVGVANTDTGDAGNPNQNNVGAAPGDHRPAAGGGGENFTLPITCIVPGRTVLLYPYLVKAVGFDSGLVVTNTSGSEAIVHFYLYEEEGRTNIDTNPDLSVLQAADPKRLVKGQDPLYDEYIEIPAYGQYVNLIFAYPGDPLAEPDYVPKAGCGTEGASGIFVDATLQDLCSQLGRVWVYAVVEQCYAHGYQMVFSEGGFGSTLALVDQDTSIEPFTSDHILAPRDADGVTNGTVFLPVHTPPLRYHSVGTVDGVDTGYRVYQYWNGNDQ